MYNPQMAPFQPENIDRTTAMLMALKEKGQLAQYMQQHKSDPYMMSLASSVNAMAEAAKPLAAPNQPTVVDQELAQMDADEAPMPKGQAQAMPEDSGIAQLPTPNMETMSAAEGGIVGYADGGMVAFGNGGDVQHFQSGGSAFERWLNSNITPVEQKRRAALQAQAEAGRLVPAPATAMEQAERNKEIVANQDFTRGDVRFPAGLTFDAPPVPKVEIPPVVAPVAAPGAGGPRAAPMAAPAGLPFIEQRQKTLAAMGPDVNPEQAAMEKMLADRAQGMEASKSEFEADVKSRADQFKGREERIGKREEELGKQKESNTGLAFLEAGLAMMQARGPALAGIAQGAGVGLKQYQSGLKDLKMAQEKLDEARDKTDELKQNQATMDAKERRSLSKEARDSSVASQQYMIDARSKIYGETKALATAATASDIATAEEAKKRATQIQAATIAAAPGLERNKMLAASQGDQAKARTEYGKLQAKVMSELAKDMTYQTATPAEKTQIGNARLREALQNNPFLSAYAANIGFGSAPTGAGTVRTLDED